MIEQKFQFNFGFCGFINIERDFRIQNDFKYSPEITSFLLSWTLPVLIFENSDQSHIQKILYIVLTSYKNKENLVT